jgi:ribosome-binding factor A
MTRRSAGGARRQYPRTARLNRLFQEILAEELERFDDTRLELVTITEVDVDAELSRAIVYYMVHDPDSEADVAAALSDHRVRLQGAIGSQARVRRVPELVFEADRVQSSAERIEAILRDLPETKASDDDEPDPDGPDGDEG